MTACRLTAKGVHHERPQPAIRQRVETTIDQLVAILDAADAPDMDLEPGGDTEPSLGSLGCISQLGWSSGNGGVHDDCELSADDIGEPDYDNEYDYRDVPKPSYGIDQTQGGPGVYICGKPAT